MDCIGKHSDDSMKLYFEISKEGRENASYTGTRIFNLWEETYSGDIAGIMFEILSPNSAYQPAG